MAMRDLGAIAGGMVEGLRTASDLNAANQQYDLRQRQIADLDRKESMRTRLAAIDPNTYRRKTATGSEYYDRGALMSEQAKAYGEFGETEKAGALLGDLDEWNNNERGRYAARIYAAHQAGDVPSVLKATSEMLERYPNGNFARPEDLTFDPKSGTISGVARDMATGQPVGNKPFQINVNKLYRTSLFDIDPKRAAELAWQEDSRAKDRAAITGARTADHRWEVMYLGDRAGKAPAKAVAAQRTNEGIFRYDETLKRNRRMTDEEIASLAPAGGGGQAAAIGEHERMALAALDGKQYDSVSDPQAAYDQRAALVRQARMRDTVAQIQASAPNGVLSFEYANDLLRGGATPELLKAAGFSADVISGFGALQR